MKVIKPSYEILDNIDRSAILKRIESMARVCYKSESSITDSSASDFVRMLIKRGHEAMIENATMSIKFICDRGVSHELVRHRLASFAQECLSGDTEIRKGLTIKQLYDRKNGTCYDKTHNKTISLRSANECGQIVPNKMLDVLYKGTGNVYEVVTSLGYRIKTTLNHEFLNQDGEFVKLSDLSVGSIIAVNGKPSLLKIDDIELIDLYNTNSAVEIAELYSVPYSSVSRRLHKLGVFIKHKNDANKEKYNSKHTEASYAKMRETILQQYTNGREPWNKGANEESYPEYIEKMRLFGKENGKINGWQLGYTPHNYQGKDYINKKRDVDYCEVCRNTFDRYEVHHLDENRENNEPENLLKLCLNCHQLLHHGWHVGKKIVPDEIVSIKFVGEEPVYDLVMQPPMNNFIANGFVVHNSSRYCNYSKDKFGNEITVIDPCFWTDKKSDLYTHWLYTCENNEREYFYLINRGAKPEEARSVLPNSLKTEIVVTMNMREWRHFFKLRTAPAAHPQMREITIPLLNELKTKLPELFDDIGEDKTEKENKCKFSHFLKVNVLTQEDLDFFIKNDECTCIEDLDIHASEFNWDYAQRALIDADKNKIIMWNDNIHTSIDDDIDAFLNGISYDGNYTIKEVCMLEADMKKYSGVKYR